MNWILLICAFNSLPIFSVNAVSCTPVALYSLDNPKLCQQTKEAFLSSHKEGRLEYDLTCIKTRE